MLVVIGGLPGTGKTTIAREVVKRRRVTYLRIDSIEQAIRSADVLAGDVGPAGYMVAYALAEANLTLGRSVVVDCVNPLPETRSYWRTIARAASAKAIEIEVVCSDLREHRRRVEFRTVDVPGLVAPTWEAVLQRDYWPWSEPRIVIDTATISAAEAADAICAEMDAQK